MSSWTATGTVVPAAPIDRFTMEATVEQVALAAAVFFALSANGPFLAAAARGHAPAELGTWAYMLALVTALASLHFVLIALVANRWTLKPLLLLLAIASALTAHFAARYGVHVDASMIRNVLQTDVAEASELITGSVWTRLLLYAAVPVALLWRVRIVRRPALRAVGVRAIWMLAAALVGVAALWAVLQPFSSFIRNNREARHLITPGNVVWSLGTVLARDVRGVAKPRQAIGLDAKPGPSWAARHKPMLFVLVVGETARAANWGLSGYARQTTPQLAGLPVINFRDVSSCGTSTEVSLPCLFAPVGRRDYDRARIQGSEGLLHVVSRAGIAVHWRDNQSGCKGVCEGLPNETVQSDGATTLCANGHCFDEVLLHGLDARLAQAQGTQLLVLHQIGNHGPAYFRRYPASFAKFVPACENEDLQHCSRAEIVNAYDNALLYTDHVLAQLIRQLASHADAVDSALLYVSDHGESLGESGLFLHGLPNAIAPDVQAKVPMVMWMSDGFRSHTGLSDSCLQERSARTASHDHVFHTVLGLLDVRTSLYESAFDLSAGCRRDSPGSNRAPL
jgi:lipid A ethanolaminephosphotransferase